VLQNKFNAWEIGLKLVQPGRLAKQHEVWNTRCLREQRFEWVTIRFGKYVVNHELTHQKVLEMGQGD
jgi:hypothetical protein